MTNSKARNRADTAAAALIALGWFGGFLYTAVFWAAALILRHFTKKGAFDE